VGRALAYVAIYLAVLGVVLTAFAFLAGAPKLATEHSGLAAWSLVVASTLVLGCVSAVLMRRYDILDAVLVNERGESAGKDERINQLSTQQTDLEAALANERGESAGKDERINQLSAQVAGLDDVLANERRRSDRKDARINQLSARLAEPTDNDIELFNRYQRELHPEASLMETLSHIIIPGIPESARELSGPEARAIIDIPLEFGTSWFINEEVEECRRRFLEAADQFATAWLRSYSWDVIDETWPEVTVKVARDSRWFELVQRIVEAHAKMFRTALQSNLTRGKPLDLPPDLE
jgi:hypothetical protein